MWLWFQLRSVYLSAPVVMLAGILVAVYILSAVAGILLWRGSSVGRILSIVIQLVQLPKLASTKLAFMMSFGFDFSFMIVSSHGPSGYGLGFNAKIGADHMLFIGNPNISFSVGISLVSCVFLYKLMGQPSEQHMPQQGVQADGEVPPI